MCAAGRLGARPASYGSRLRRPPKPSIAKGYHRATGSLPGLPPITTPVAAGGVLVAVTGCVLHWRRCSTARGLKRSPAAASRCRRWPTRGSPGSRCRSSAAPRSKASVAPCSVPWVRSVTRCGSRRRRSARPAQRPLNLGRHCRARRRGRQALVECVTVGPTGADIRLRVEGQAGLVRDLRPAAGWRDAA